MSQKTDIVEQVRAELLAYKGSIAKLSLRCGLTYPWLISFRCGRLVSPSYRHFVILEKALREESK